MQVSTRLKGLEKVAAKKFDDHSHEGMHRWTARFSRAAPRHAAIIEEIHTRTAIHAGGMYRGPGDHRMHVGLCLFSLLGQLNLPKRDVPWYDPNKRVPDWEVATRLLNEYAVLLGTYQVKTGDMFPVDGYGLEATVQFAGKKPRRGGAVQAGPGLAECLGGQAVIPQTPAP